MTTLIGLHCNGAVANPAKVGKGRLSAGRPDGVGWLSPGVSGWQQVGRASGCNSTFGVGRATCATVPPASRRRNTKLKLQLQTIGRRLRLLLVSIFMKKLLGIRNVLPGMNSAAWRRCGAGVSLAILMLTGISVLAQSDDFNDGNDAGWTRYDPIGSHPQLPDIATFGVVSNAYRIRTTPSPLPEVVGPSRAGGIRRDVSYTDFYATVDLVEWDDTLQQSVGILARVREVGLGTTDGYVLTYNFRGKDIDITRFTDEDGAGGSLTLVGDDKLELVKGKKYRLVFFGRGTEFGARVFDLDNLSTPVLSVTASDATYDSGFCGLLVYDNSAAQTLGTDATFDNYFATIQEPPQLEVFDLGFGLVQVRWPGRAADFVLESTDAWPATRWAPVSELEIGYFPEVDRYIYPIDASSGKQFFRLIRR